MATRQTAAAVAAHDAPKPEKHVTVETHRPVVHQASGFNAPLPGRYDFPYRKEYGNWLRGQAERGALTLLEGDPDGMPETSAVPPNDGNGFAIGADVVYTPEGSDKGRRTSVVAVNDDGTYELKGGPKKAQLAQLQAVAGE